MLTESTTENMARQSLEATSKGPGGILSEPSEACFAHKCTGYSFPLSKKLELSLCVSFQDVVISRWSAEGLAKGCEHSCGAAWPPQKLREDWKVAERAVNTQ